jgi:SNF2 family DNA or RNA helicase
VTWLWSKKHQEICRLLETKNAWGQVYHTVWLPRAKAVVKLAEDELSSLEESSVLGNGAYLTYTASAAKVFDSLQKDALLSPLGASIIPLPHQIKTLSKALSGDKIRYLLADEVGLGKTIEAGLIIRELKLRGMVKRILIVAPRGLVTQWISEMKLKFGEDFKLLLPEDIETVHRLFPDPQTSDESGKEGMLPHLQEMSQTGTASHRLNPFALFDQVICTVDSFKPLKRRKGWTQKDVDEHNQMRYQNLISANWDLIIVDEAHRLGGSTDQVARYKLGKGLAEAAPYLLLLTATPHQGKSDAFLRLLYPKGT